KAPEVLKAVSVNLPVNIFLGMVDNFVSVFLSQPVIRLQGIGVESRSSFDMLFNASMESGTLSVCYYGSANLPAALQGSEHDGLVFSASTSDAPFAFVELHVPRFTADESLIDFDF